MGERIVIQKLKLAFVLIGITLNGLSCSSSSLQPPSRTLATQGASLKLVNGTLPAEGIYALDLGNDSIQELANIPSTSDGQNIIKYSFLDRGNNSYDFSCAPDSEGDIYGFSTNFQKGSINSSPAALRIIKATNSYLNGPTYCEKRKALAFGEVQATSVWVKTISQAHLERLQQESVLQASKLGMIKTIQSDDFQISTDLYCGNLPKGIVYNGLNCQGSTSVMDCLGSSTYLSSIHYKESEKKEAVQLSFPELDPTIISSPTRIPNSPGKGDMDPNILVIGENNAHLMFERMYTTPEVFQNPNLAVDFKQGGFGNFYYKHLGKDPKEAAEYQLDFSQWNPAPHKFLIFPYMKIDSVQPDVIEFAGLANFKTPNVSTGGEDGWTGLITAQFNYKNLSTKDKTIVIDPTTVHQIIGYGDFTCRVWDSYGMAPDGNVYIYGLYAPKFLSAGGRDYLVFSSAKSRMGTLENNIVTFANGTSQPSQQFYQGICKAK
jgi:hypothetical protein